MLDRLEIRNTGPLTGTVRPPGSKSITNRALVCAALANGQSLLEGVLDSDDTRVMIDGLRALGLELEADRSAKIIRITGCKGRIPATTADLFIGNSGTTVRFLTALVALGHGTYRLDGTARMRERPIADLIETLRQLGADVRSEHNNGCPPVIVNAHGLAGGLANIRGDISSQFLSALLMAAPYAQSPLEITVTGALVSQPYIEMTLACMAAFGVIAVRQGPSRFVLSNQHGYQGRRYVIEPDASAASYFFGAAAVTGGTITVEGLSRNSLQGDVAFVDVLEQMGCAVHHDSHSITVTGRPLTGVDVDMNAISDTVQTLGAVALFAEGPTTVRGVAHIRHKETDRIGALATELRKLGATVDELHDGLRITPGSLHGAQIQTYDDHRMAMSLALAGLKIPGVVIHDPGCTSKTYPEFFQDLASLSARK